MQLATVVGNSIRGGSVVQGGGDEVSVRQRPLRQQDAASVHSDSENRRRTPVEVARYEGDNKRQVVKRWLKKASEQEKAAWAAERKKMREEREE